MGGDVYGPRAYEGGGGGGGGGGLYGWHSEGMDHGVGNGSCCFGGVAGGVSYPADQAWAATWPMAVSPEPSPIPPPTTPPPPLVPVMPPVWPMSPVPVWPMPPAILPMVTQYWLPPHQLPPAGAGYWCEYNYANAGFQAELTPDRDPGNGWIY